jgi:hypothetical protein
MAKDRRNGSTNAGAQAGEATSVEATVGDASED